MPIKIEDSAIVETEPGQLPVLTVHVLERLGYRVTRHSKRVGEIIAGQQLNEQIGRDWFRSDYQVVLAFRKASSGCLINVEVTERTGGGTSGDCQKRCDEIIIKLQADAARAKQMALEQEKSTIHGSSRWGTEDDLRQAGYLTNNPAGTQLIMGRASTGEFIAVPERVSYAHALVVGRTGVGKSTGFFIPNIIERVGVNMIITEATPDYGPGELYTLTSGWRERAGHEVMSFNPSVMSSTRINPIDRIRNAPDVFKAREAERLADLLITNGEKPGTRTDPVFNRSEKHLLLSLLMYSACSSLEYGHIGALRWLMLQGVEDILDAMTRCPSEVAQMEFNGWVRDTTEGFRYSIAAGLKTKMNSWLTDQVVALTERTDIDLKTMNEKLWTFYIAVPNRSSDSQLLGSLMFNFLIEHILDQGANMKYRTALMLD